MKSLVTRNNPKMNGNPNTVFEGLPLQSLRIYKLFIKKSFLNATKSSNTYTRNATCIQKKIIFSEKKLFFLFRAKETYIKDILKIKNV